MMTEMEFFKVFELTPKNSVRNPTLECWKRGSGLYGEIIEWDSGEFHVREGGNMVGTATTFNRALRMLIKNVEVIM